MATLGLEIEKGLYLGIDFGTTNCVVSIYNYDEGEVHTVSIDGSNIFPTVIQFEEDIEEEGKLNRIFGIQAKEGAIIYPDSTVMSIKRLLGSDNIINISTGEKDYEFKPENIAAEIIAHLKEKADEYIREELSMAGEFEGCVITVPANSTDKQKKRTKEAAVMAGFDEEKVFLRLEPAAAAISYAIGEKDTKTILVYDFGGGTFDACILKIKGKENNEPEISIISTYGDNNLGGNDIDKLMVDIIYEEFKKMTNNNINLYDFDVDDGVSKKHKKMALVRLHQIANQAKERLSTSKTTKVTMAPFISEPTIVNINMEITRECFLSHKRINKLDDSEDTYQKVKSKNLKELIESTMKCVEKCLDSANLHETDIDEIFLVGGSSSIPEIRNQIIEKFNKEPYKSKISPALSISQGAAFYCNMIMLPTVKGPKMNEKTVHPLGLEISGRRFLEIVGRGVEIPLEGLTIESKELLETNYDDVTSMAIVVYEDTMPNPDKDILKFVYEDGMRRLAGTTLRGIPANKKGEEKVKVIFSIGQDNILTVKAISTSTEGIETSLAVDELY